MNNPNTEPPLIPLLLGFTLGLVLSLGLVLFMDSVSPSAFEQGVEVRSE